MKSKAQSDRMKQLEREEHTANKALDHKRSLAKATQEAHAKQDECVKRAREYDKRRQATQMAALREQEALQALGMAKSEEGMAKRALLRVGQVG